MPSATAIPRRAAEGGAKEGAAEATAACEGEPRRQETINLIALDELVELFAM